MTQATPRPGNETTRTMYDLEDMADTWFKTYPSKVMLEARRIADPALRCAFYDLLFQCLHDGVLPDDDDEIAYIVSLPVEVIKALRPHLKRIAKAENGSLIFRTAEEMIRERAEFSEKKALAGQKGGLARAKSQVVEPEEDTDDQPPDGSGSSNDSESQAQPSTAKHSQAQLSTSQASLSHTNIQTYKNTNPRACTPARVINPANPFQPESDPVGESDSIDGALKASVTGLDDDWRQREALCRQVLNAKASAADVHRWAEWLPVRYPGKIPNRFTFRDTFPLMLREDGAKSTAYLFVFFACGHKDGAQLSARVEQEISREAAWLGSQMPEDRTSWKTRGLMPQQFRAFWTAQGFTGYATPEKVRTYWPRFREWAEQSSNVLQMPAAVQEAA